MSPRFKGLGSAALVGAAALAAAADVAPVPAAALRACAAISAPTKRLECYDQLAASLATSPALAPAAAAPPPVPPAAPATPTVPAKESFGLYAAEHPAAPPATASLAAIVAGLGVSATGYPTVTLEGGQVWELDSADPVLVSGDSVTIKRAAFGSFLMTTTKGRTHRVHRLR